MSHNFIRPLVILFDVTNQLLRAWQDTLHMYTGPNGESLWGQ